MLRRCGYDGHVDDDRRRSPTSPYDRPNLSKDYLAGNAQEEWIPLRPDGFYDEHRIDVVRGRVDRIDRRIEARWTLAGRGTLPLRHSCSSRPAPNRFISALPGDDRPHVHYLRSLADSRAIIAASETATRAVVIGAQLHRARGRGVAARPQRRGARRRAGGRCRSSECSAPDARNIHPRAARGARRRLPSRHEAAAQS